MNGLNPYPMPVAVVSCFMVFETLEKIIGLLDRRNRIGAAVTYITVAEIFNSQFEIRCK
jgi:hypothetical protein